MSDLQAPTINWQVKAGDSKAGFGEQRLLLIAPGTGTNPTKTLIEDVQQKEVNLLCGMGSMSTRAFNRIKKFNKANEIDIVTLDEPSAGTNSEGGLSTTGDAQENKTLELSIGDDQFTVKAVILDEDTATQITAKIVAAINTKYNVAKEGNLFVATIDADDATLATIEYGTKGECGNGLIIKVKNRVLGCTFTPVEFTGGAAVYDTANILDNLTKRYQTVIFDASMNFDDLETWLQARINLSNAVKGGAGILFKNGTLSAVKAYADAKNSQTMIVFGNLNEMKYNLMPLLAAAEFGAKRAIRLTDGAIIGDLVLSAHEAFGGINKASLPYHNTPMTYAKPNAEITITQVADLNDSGVSLMVPATIGVVLGAVVTLYKTDLSGVEDKTFKYLNAMDTSIAVQEYFFVNCQKVFGQTRSTGGDLVAGVAMTNTLSVQAFIIGLYVDLIDYALVQGGDAVKSFKKTLTVTLNAETGIYSVYAPVAIVSQFRGLNGVVAIGYNFK